VTNTPNIFRGWSNHAYNKSKMADCRHLKNHHYLRYGLIDGREIWHYDANCTVEPTDNGS